MDGMLAAAPRLRPVLARDGRRRWFTELHPDDLRRYERAVAACIPAIERSLGRQVFANRARMDGSLRPVGPARREWEAALRAVAAREPGGAAVLADVRRCYASIGAAAVERSLAQLGVVGMHRGPVVRLIEALAREGVRGVPIGPAPSAILANGVLAEADLAARRAGATVFRWVDDVVILAGDRAGAARGFDAWVGALGWVGLVPNEAKTRRLDEVGACEPLAGRTSRALGVPVP